MSLLRTFLGSLAVLLAIALTAPDARAECRLAPARAAVIGSTSVWLQAALENCAAPLESWIEVETDPTFPPLSWPRRAAGELARAPGGTRTVDARLGGLKAQTTYYFRAVARLPDGTVAASNIAEFRTLDYEQVVVPDCRYRDQVRNRSGRRDGIDIVFVCQDYPYLGVVHFLLGTDPGMTGAKRAIGPSFTGSALPSDERFTLFLADDDWPAGTTLHVQMVAENTSGSARGPVVAIPLNRP